MSAKTPLSVSQEFEVQGNIYNIRTITVPDAPDVLVGISPGDKRFTLLAATTATAHEFYTAVTQRPELLESIERADAIFEKARLYKLESAFAAPHVPCKTTAWNDVICTVSRKDVRNNTPAAQTMEKVLKGEDPQNPDKGLKDLSLVGNEFILNIRNEENQKKLILNGELDATAIKICSQFLYEFAYPENEDLRFLLEDLLNGRQTTATPEPSPA